MFEKLKKFGWGYLFIGALLISVGVLFISAQDAYETMAIIMGCILAATGIGFIVYTLLDSNRGLKFGFRISVSVIAIICGIVTMVVRSNAIAVIANVLFLFLIIDGAFKLQLSTISRRLSYYGWWIVTSLSIAIIITAFLLSKFTPKNPATLATLSGIVIISDGILNLLSAFFSSAINTKDREGKKESEEDNKPEETKEPEEVEKPAVEEE